MDICVITNDARLARFIVLELCDAGYTAVHGTESDKAKLCICDLDCIEDLPDGCVGFSYDESKRELVRDFLKRPIDAGRLRSIAAKRLADTPLQSKSIWIEASKNTRKLKSDSGEVRLSEKEFALFELLCKSGTVSREEGAKVFGEQGGNIVDVYVHYLRKKLAKICDGETVKPRRGIGYSLSDTLNIQFT